jgi:hypothetical protein
VANEPDDGGGGNGDDVDAAAVAAYRASLVTGKPLSERKLAPRRVASRTQRQPIQERGDHVLRILAVLCPQRQKRVLYDEPGKET